MKRVERLWIQAIDRAIDDKVINLLSKLKVIKSDVWRSYMQDSHIKLNEYRAQKERKKARSSSNNYKHYQPPRSIKPTKQRRF